MVSADVGAEQTRCESKESTELGRRVAEGDAIRAAVNATLESGVGTEDLHPTTKVGTDEMGDIIAKKLGAA